MGGRAQGFQVFWRGKRDAEWAYVRFTHQKVEHRISLGTQDPDEAAVRAKEEYAAAISGRGKRLTQDGRIGRTLLNMAELLSEWIAAQEGSLDKETCATLTTYAKHYLAFFGRLDRVFDKGATSDYGRARLRKVLRKTVLKELSYLRSFLDWCKEHGAIDEVPVVPPPPKKATGTRAGKQRSAPVEITAEQAEAILLLLPEESKRIGSRTWPIRERFVVAWETGLRPETLDIISSPANYRRGAEVLTVEDHQDKARFGRSIPLTARARAALDTVVPDDGLIFGSHRFDKVLKRAATTVLGPELGRKFAPYDFRHGRVTHMLDHGAPLTGAAFLVGHKRVTTTNRYTKPNIRAAEKALQAVELVHESAHSAPKLLDQSSATHESAEKQGWPTRLELATPGATTQRTSQDPAYLSNDKVPDGAQSRPEDPQIRPMGEFATRPPRDVQDYVAARLTSAKNAVEAGDEASTLTHLAKAAKALVGVGRVA